MDIAQPQDLEKGLLKLDDGARVGMNQPDFAKHFRPVPRLAPFIVGYNSDDEVPIPKISNKPKPRTMEERAKDNRAKLKEMIRFSCTSKAAELTARLVVLIISMYTCALFHGLSMWAFGPWLDNTLRVPFHSWAFLDVVLAFILLGFLTIQFTLSLIWNMILLLHLVPL